MLEQNQYAFGPFLIYSLINNFLREENQFITEPAGVCYLGFLNWYLLTVKVNTSINVEIRSKFSWADLAARSEEVVSKC